MTLKVTDNQYGRLSWRQLGFLFLYHLLVIFNVTWYFQRFFIADLLLSQCVKKEK